MKRGFQTYLAPAKINVFLHIVGQRKDGYHLLQSVFQLLDLCDEIAIKITNNSDISRVNDVAGVTESDDISIKAARLLQAHAQSLDASFNSGALIKVNKVIPMGGGLGGGSSDAATVLMALNKAWQLNFSRQTLMDLGLTLGADVPFFIFGKNAWVEGIGEVLSPIELSANHYVVLNPGINVSTMEIFNNKELTKNTIPKTMSNFSESGTNQSDLRASNIKSDFINGLEKTVCQLYPAVRETIDWLSQYGDARMTGSGASVFVEVADKSSALSILSNKPKDTTGFVAKGLAQHPLYDFCF